MISPSGSFKIYVATEPVDFRKGIDGLAAIVHSEFNLDPFSGALFVFRSRRSDRLKIVLWDGTGLVLIYKRIEGRGFVWPQMRNGTIELTKVQFEALFEGLDWRSVRRRLQVTPKVA